MKYKDYIKKTTEKFQSLTKEITAEYNFDFGNEYEVVLCTALRNILPEKYGICRGFVTTEDNQVAGDDIIIYDRYRFNSIRPLLINDYSRKEYIPIEAVYAYIEAKYTLTIEGNGGQSLNKACNQVSNVKALPRKDIPLNSIDPYMVNMATKVTRPNWPNKLNPLFGVVFCHQVRLKTGDKILKDANSIYTALIGNIIDVPNFPDLIVAGNSNIILPFREYDNAKTKTYHSPFHISKKTMPNVFKVDEIAFGIGMTDLMYALDTIRLGIIPWPKLIGEGLGLD